jgi:hypothetical protein
VPVQLVSTHSIERGKGLNESETDIGYPSIRKNIVISSQVLFHNESLLH